MAETDGEGRPTRGIAARFSRPLAFAVLAEAGATVTMIATFRLASDLWGATGFAVWVLSRRVIAFLLPVMTIGMEIALPRFVALDVDGPISRFLAAACLLVSGTTLLLLALVWSFDSTFAGILFGDTERQYLLLPIFLLAFGYACNTLLYGYLRGRMAIMSASLVHLVAFGALPLTSIYLFGTSPEQTITVLGGIVGGVAVTALAFVLLVARPPMRASMGALPSIFAFGATRAIAALLLMLLFLLPAAIVANRSGIESAGAVGFAVSIVTIAASAFGPLVLIILPVASRLVASGRVGELRNALHRLERFIWMFGIGVFVLMFLAAPWIAILVTGDRSADIELAVKLAAFAAGPFAYFICIRNIVDACTNKAFVSWILLLSLMVFGASVLALAVLGVESPVGVMCSYVLAIWMLAAMSAIAVHRLLRGMPS